MWLPGRQRHRGCFFYTVDFISITLLLFAAIEGIRGQCSVIPACADSRNLVITSCPPGDCNAACRGAIRQFLENINCGIDALFDLFRRPERENPRLVAALNGCGYAIQAPNAGTNLDSVNVVWEQVGLHYPFMCRFSVDWPQLYYDTIESVNPATPSDELFDIIVQGVLPINDAEFALLEYDTTVTPPSLSRVYQGGSLPEWSDGVPRWYNVTNGYLRGNPEALIPERLLYATVESNRPIGYMRILNFQAAPILATWETALDRLGTAFARAESIIIDVRFSTEGDDVVALAVASRFTTTQAPALLRRTKLPNLFMGCCAFDYGPTQTLCLQPTIPNFANKRIVILTSAATMGAAEAFVMMMRRLPGCLVTVIGERTQGAPTDVLFFTLPNGWMGAVPHKVYLDSLGNSYQGTGIPPDLVQAMGVASFDETPGHDQIMQAAIAYLQQNPACQTCLFNNARDGTRRE